jgi:hypothetical protein
MNNRGRNRWSDDLWGGYQSPVAPKKKFNKMVSLMTMEGKEISCKLPCRSKFVGQGYQRNDSQSRRLNIQTEFVLDPRVNLGAFGASVEIAIAS